ncbi:hypothetical protein HELRODRAFT_176402 [Helobdella robusta]|uniref:Uncharacterized protein n=1 Tax=Helobdella robusta TaxID=6412 RepID=T1FAH5_HELRO|nr:hypothetical protein HELRODRAFT_176402 [Helobdella robusta]ESO00092.1 hypothetical protein HELRODRAFT_176402 [Helobdella robusta]
MEDSYVGCYRNVYPTKTKPSVYNVLECVEFCIGETSNMIALIYGKKCSCIDRLDSAVASYRCDIPCSNNDTCGGGRVYSVYKGKPRIMHDAFFGTDNIQQATVVNNLPHFYYLEMCAHICLELNLSFFQTMKDNKCTCLDAYSYLVPRRTKTILCSTTCNSDKTEICACHFKGLDTLPVIFSTRFQYDFQRGKSIYSHCKEKFSESFLPCPPSGCQDGWKGGACIERDCSRNNGDCGHEMKCVEVVINSYEYVECVCPYGTVRNKWNLCEVYRENIAILKPSNMSSVFQSAYNRTSYGANYINDNVYDGFTYSKIADNKNGWISVDLTMLYSVGFVRVYNKICESEAECRALEKFIIRLNKSFEPFKGDFSSFLDTCGHGPSQVLQGGNPMVVICENFALRSRYVIIQQSDTSTDFGKLAVAELEVYEVGCDILNGRCKKSQKCMDIVEQFTNVVRCREWDSVRNISKPFYGCFEKVDAEYEHDEYGLSYEACKKVCNLNKFILSVMKAGIKCSCGNNVRVYDQLSKELCRSGDFQSNLVFYTCFTDRRGFCNDVSNDLETTVAISSHTNSSRTDVKLIVIGALSGSIFVMSAIFAVVSTMRKKKRDEEDEKNKNEESETEDVKVDVISMDTISVDNVSQLGDSQYD